MYHKTVTNREAFSKSRREKRVGSSSHKSQYSFVLVFSPLVVLFHWDLWTMVFLPSPTSSVNISISISFLSSLSLFIYFFIFFKCEFCNFISLLHLVSKKCYGPSPKPGKFLFTDLYRKVHPLVRFLSLFTSQTPT